MFLFFPHLLLDLEIIGVGQGICALPCLLGLLLIVGRISSSSIS